MIKTSEALDLVISSANPADTELIPFSESIGRILAENILADRAIPPFHRVSMDGIAINYQSFHNGRRVFEVEKIIGAGEPTYTLKDSVKCVEIMTGAPLPNFTDTVIRYEDLTKVEDKFQINIHVLAGKNVHKKGSDHMDRSVLIEKNSVIKAIDINLIATVGKSQVRVYKNPKIAVISSGDELIEVHEFPQEHQIRRSNVHMLIAALKERNLDSVSFHLKDKPELIESQLREILEDFDLVLLSGGVSKGKFDYIPKVLEKIGIQKSFHTVAQRPGKPFWFGNNDKNTVFAFPGNPVSTLACFYKYCIPWLEQTNAIPTRRKVFVQLKEEVQFSPDLTYLAQAKLHMNEQGQLTAKVVHGNGSGDMVSPSKMDGFIELPIGTNIFHKGSVHQFIPFHPIIF